ncbi:MAG TPA: carboxymuconolactone decarboxylase family protein [Polyangiales bacterium]|jgi:alkyl hydroperoxide reductase subunit D|nr:carboxymuconolactone decarboxylase family protein [Polyangiales bacterium]
MSNLEQLRAELPESARDIKLNLQSVMQGGALSTAQRWGVAVASAAAARNPRLRDALVAAARREVEPAVIDDAFAAAALMAMNNVYYRFRHVIGKPSYSEKPARLRMNRLAKPATSKVDFELFSLAVSAINGCEMCVRSHEQVVLEGGLSEEHVHDAVRIAAVIHAAAVALEIAESAADASEAPRVAS